jgi:hypothetical protein
LPLYGTGLFIAAKHYDECGSELNKDEQIDNTLNMWIMVNSMIALGSGLISLPCLFCIPTSFGLMSIIILVSINCLFMMAWEVFGGASLFGPIGDLCKNHGGYILWQVGVAQFVVGILVVIGLFIILGLVNFRRKASKDYTTY